MPDHEIPALGPSPTPPKDLTPRQTTIRGPRDERRYRKALRRHLILQRKARKRNYGSLDLEQLRREN